MSPNNQPPDMTSTIVETVEQGGAATRPLDFLIVDDSAVMRAVITKLVKMSGLPVGQIHHAADGVKALAVLETHTVDLMTVDILIVSSERREERTREIEASGGGFLQKPFDAEQLRAAVLRVLEISDV
jgi:two-component system chemotaxis response regulator CheY